jgi:hypothetical protein
MEMNMQATIEEPISKKQISKQTTIVVLFETVFYSVCAKWLY